MRSRSSRAWIPASRFDTSARAALRAAENFRFFADRAPGARDGVSLPTTTHVNYTMRVPIGPVGIITPWNAPFMLATWKIAPALAAGCTVVHKPAEWSPLTATLLVEIMNDAITAAGLPPGVVNVVHGLGETAGKALTEHPAIKAIGFVGDSVDRQPHHGAGRPPPSSGCTSSSAARTRWSSSTMQIWIGRWRLRSS